jgi:hypothetical protein
LRALGLRGGGVSESVIDLFYRLSFFHFVAGLVGGIALLVRTYFNAKSALVRQQMKWVVWGTLLSVAPFILLYGVVYLFGASTDRWLTDIAVLPLILIPLAFGNSVVRYRLMDVDIVVRRAAVYALTTVAIALMIGAVVYIAGLYALVGEVAISELTLRVAGAVAAMTAIVMIAAPIKKLLQERTDRLFYGERYDMRNGLLDAMRIFDQTLIGPDFGVTLGDSLARVKEKFGEPAFILQEPGPGAGQNYIYPISQVGFQLARPAPGDQPRVVSLLIFNVK